MSIKDDMNVNLTDIEEDNEDNYFGELPKNFNFYPEVYRTSIEALVLRYKGKRLLIPDFQREFVWSIQQASLFIETLMFNLPRPSIFFYCDEKSNNFIIDGQQRLKSVFCFLGALSENDIPPKEKNLLNFRLTGLDPQSPWYNKTYADFSEPEKITLLDRAFDIVTIYVKNDNDKKIIYHIFKRINTGGTKLTEQEIRNCIYTGKFNDLLHTLASNPTWQKLITLDKPQGRLKDVELILRFFALYDDMLSYNNPMKTFLSDYMQKKSNISGEEIQAKQKLFEITINSIDKHLQKNPFHTKNQLNSSVCDSIMIGFAKNLDNIPSDIQDRYKKLTRYNNEYETATSKSSNTKANVYKRIQMVESLLFTPKKNSPK